MHAEGSLSRLSLSDRAVMFNVCFSCIVSMLMLHYMLLVRRFYPKWLTYIQYCGQSPQEQFGVKCVAQGHNAMLTAVGLELATPWFKVQRTKFSAQSHWATASPCDTWSCCDASQISDLIWPMKYYRIVTYYKYDFFCISWFKSMSSLMQRLFKKITIPGKYLHIQPETPLLPGSELLQSRSTRWPALQPSWPGPLSEHRTFKQTYSNSLCWSECLLRV